jgi:hypothetical protein
MSDTTKDWMGDIGSVLESGLKGAAAGSVIPGLGTAIGALVGLATAGVPTIGKWIFGADATAVTKAVTDVAQAVTRTTTPEAAAAVLADDPAMSEAFRLQVAMIAGQRDAEAERAFNERFLAIVADQGNARQQTLALAQTGSWLAWGAPIISVVVMLTFGLIVSLTLTCSMPPGSEPILNVLLGTLSAMAMSVVSYWVGSSVGSVHKQDLLAARQ